MDKKHIVSTVVAILLVAPIIVLVAIFWDSVIRVVYNIFLAIIGFALLCAILRHMCMRISAGR